MIFCNTCSHIIIYRSQRRRRFIFGFSSSSFGCRLGGDPGDAPIFVVQGVPGAVLYWCDCLGDDFRMPRLPPENPPK